MTWVPPGIFKGENVARTSTKIKTVNIPDLVKDMQDTYCMELTKAQIKYLIDSLRDDIMGYLEGGVAVNLTGLGTFIPKSTKARVGRNPRTGERVEIPARRRVAFKVCSSLKKRM